MLMGLCDTDIAKAYKYTANNISDNPQTFTSTLMMSYGKLDILSICTPPSTHRELVEASAPYVKAIWLEKPIAETLEDADEIIKVCKHYGILLQVNHQRRSTLPTFRFSRGWLNSGTHAIDLLRQSFGEIESANQDFVYFKNGTVVRIIYQNTTEPIFHLDMTHSGEPMLPAMLENIIDALSGSPLLSPGEEARETLKWVLKMKGDYETSCN